MTLRTYKDALAPQTEEAIRNIGESLSWHSRFCGLSGEGECAFVPDQHWLSGVIFHYGALANNELWNYDIVGSSAVQFYRFRKGEGFLWHNDHLGLTQKGNLVRKLTVVIDLQSNIAVQGGELQIMATEQESKERILHLDGGMNGGSIHVFPSFLPFRTTSVNTGLRIYAVGWIVGPKFK